jgi:hypothetical protein
MRSHFKKFALSMLLGLLGLLSPQSAQAQVTYTSPQTVTSTAFNNIACTGTTQRALIPNLGQVGHFITLTLGVIPHGISTAIQGSYDGVLFFDISNTVTFANGLVQPTGQGQGYYPVVAVRVNCLDTTGRFTVFYTGTGGSIGPPSGSAVVSQVIQNITISASDGTSNQFSLNSPFGNSGGALILQANGAMPAGSNVELICDLASAVANVVGPFAIPTTAGVFSFPIPNYPCATPEIQFFSGGASSNTYNLYYSFSQPGLDSPAFLFSHITGTTATSVKSSPSSFLHNLTVNTGAAGTISIFDLASSSCTGTPSTNTAAVITATATTLQTFTYDINFVNGICVKASVAMDITVSSK